ncbi:phosphinothricin acetyltransferase [Kibdelosporangium banguiense]|uniref:Phosphinothricin acetyltransferase n=1 Tax=Kibdelosporangium banguiense TaxID=1365924 RepID=A0ABS4TSC8_9PSEU|nr:GNAT family N-acetyltransferase [Kibdelosporangium banguiense]MBP2327307.1 phosphinothricin acetyltransferase [Kibdelosporangium banguiense]
MTGTINTVRMRAAQETDVPAINDIYNEAVADQVATCDLSNVPVDERRDWLARQRHPYGVWVAVDSAGVEGWVGLFPYDSKPCFHRTATFATYVRRSARGKGVGRQLRAWMIDRAREHGFHTIVNRVWATNDASIALAKRFGFVEVGRMRELVDVDGTYVDCVFFQLVLEAGEDDDDWGVG